MKTGSLGAWVHGWLGRTSVIWHVLSYVTFTLCIDGIYFRRAYTNPGPYVLIGARLTPSK